MIRRLVTLLDFSGSRTAPTGAFGKAQARIAKSLKPGWRSSFLNPAGNAAAYAQWLAILQSARIRQAVPFGQVFSGRVMTIRGQDVHCGEKLKFFKGSQCDPRPVP